jgi:hypothetical protein
MMDFNAPPFFALPVCLEVAIICDCLAVAIRFDEGELTLHPN